MWKATAAAAMAGCSCSSPFSTPSLFSHTNSNSNSNSNSTGFPILFNLSSKAPSSPSSTQFRSHSLLRPIAAAVSIESPPLENKKLLLEVKDLTASIAESHQKILNGVNLKVYEGEVHAIMGKNGSGKSTFSKECM